MLESQYQKKVIKQYEAKGYFVIKLIKTNKVGIPDLIAVKPDEAVFIEVKGRKTITTTIQEYRHKELREKGFTVIIDREP